MAEGYGFDHDCEGKGYLGGGGLLLRWRKIVKMVKRSFRFISVLDFLVNVIPNELHYFFMGHCYIHLRWYCLYDAGKSLE